MQLLQGGERDVDSIVSPVAITSRMLAARGPKQAEKLGVDPARVPPGQYLTERFPVLSVGPNPKYDLAAWELTVFGEVERELRLSWDELKALPQHDVTLDIHCVTRWSKLDTTWTGPLVRDVLDLAEVKPSGTHLMAHSYEGKPLEHDHGAPLRLIVPRRYFWKSAKFLRKLEVMSQDRMGFWELNGYHNDADPWQEQRHWF